MDKVLQKINRILVVNRYINRPVAGLLVRFLKRTRITPNQVTIASFLIGASGAGFFLTGKLWGFLCGGILVQLSSIADCADGMLARATSISSLYGAYLDIFLDRINECFFLSAGVIGWYFYTRQTTILILGLMAIIFYFMQIILYYLIKRYQSKHMEGETNEARALLLLAVFIFGVLGRLDLGIYVLMIVTVVLNIILVIRFARIPLKKENSHEEISGSQDIIISDAAGGDRNLQ
jgi:phosphatidylglycerophosphate synthase